MLSKINFIVHWVSWITTYETIEDGKGEALIARQPPFSAIDLINAVTEELSLTFVFYDDVVRIQSKANVVYLLEETIYFRLKK